MKIKRVVILLSIAFICPVNSSYQDIEILPFKAWDWFCNATQLTDIIKQERPKIVVELGSWLGTSTAFFAQNIDAEGKVYAIDIWDETPECTDVLRQSMNKEELKYFYATLYQQFLSNMIHLKLEDKVIPFRSKTVIAASLLDVQPDLVYVDACHNEEDVYSDIMVWYQKLKPGGTMCGDDWSWDGVRRGVERAAARLNQVITPDGNFWRFGKRPNLQNE